MTLTNAMNIPHRATGDGNRYNRVCQKKESSSEERMLSRVTNPCPLTLAPHRFVPQDRSR